MQNCTDLTSKLPLKADSKENYLIRGENVVLLGEVSDADLLSRSLIQPKNNEKKQQKEAILKRLGFSIDESLDAY